MKKIKSKIDLHSQEAYLNVEALIARKKKSFFISFLISFFIKIAMNFSVYVVLVIFVILIYVVDKVLLQKAKQKALDDFDSSLIDGLLSLASSLKAGLTIQGAFEVAIKSTEDIFAKEAAMIISDYKLGVHIDEALEKVKTRIPTDNTNMAFGALIIGRQIGGPLPLILDRIATTIRDSEKVEGRLKALTAQGKGQAAVLCGLPVLVGIGYALFSPHRMHLMQTELLGQVLLGLTAALEVVGIFVTLKMLELDI